MFQKKSKQKEEKGTTEKEMSIKDVEVSVTKRWDFEGSKIYVTKSDETICITVRENYYRSGYVTFSIKEAALLIEVLQRAI